jgi:hypothetical protein
MRLPLVGGLAALLLPIIVLIGRMHVKAPAKVPFENPVDWLEFVPQKDLPTHLDGGIALVDPKIVSDVAFGRLVALAREARPMANRVTSPGVATVAALPGPLLPDAFKTLYQSKEISDIVSHVINGTAGPVSLTQPNSCTILYYNETGDGFKWHTDASMFVGGSYSVMIPLVSPTKAKFRFQEQVSKPWILGTVPYGLLGEPSAVNYRDNSMIVFDDTLFHATDPLTPGEERILLFMVFTQNEDQALWQAVNLFVKDYLYFRRLV